MDLEQAWKYFQEVGPYSRIMAADGTIFADWYDMGEPQMHESPEVKNEFRC
jgi:hypothetical protein